MQPIIERSAQALRLGHFETARALVCSALMDTETPAARLPLLEILAQAQVGLQDHPAAAQTWQRAYEQAATPADSSRLFEHACQAYQRLRDYPALLHLAQTQLPHARSAQERAACLLVAGEVLLHLRQYQEARQRYLAPALGLAGVTPETRAYLWHDLGLSALAEHDFAAAAEAFRRSAECALGTRFTPRIRRAPEQDAALHHLRNTAQFYDGIIHLIYHRPHQAVQALQALQRPLTAVGALNNALFLALAYRHLQQPAAAERAVHTLARSPACPDTLRGPYAVVCAGIANLRQAAAMLGTHVETALDSALSPRTSWEPSWRALLYQELGLALRRAGYCSAASACYEESLKVTAHRTGKWYDPRHSDWLRGPSLLTALENLPLHTWSAVIQGEMLRPLQALAWLYNRAQHDTLADTALALALRLATTPVQQASLWFQRGWLAASRPQVGQQDVGDPSLSRAQVLLGVQTARAHHANTPLAGALRGVEALLQGDAAQALDCFVEVPEVPEVPEIQALCVATWLWAQTRQGRLEHVLRDARATALPWQTVTTLADALEILLAWTTGRTAPATAAIVAWLAPLLAQQESHTLPALRWLCRPGYLPEAQRAALTAALTSLLTSPAYAALADQVAELLGGSALLDRIDTWLAQLDGHLTSTLAPPRHVARHHRQRAAAPGSRSPYASHLLHLIRRLEGAGSAAMECTLPEVIRDWLVRYPRLGTSAPEVVGALLGLLRQRPTAHAAMQSILDQVPLSRRQRQALEMALQTPPQVATATPSHPLAWEPIRYWPLARLLEELQDIPQQHVEHLAGTPAARAWYVLAVALSRVGMLSHAADCLHACLRLQPTQPLVHCTLAQIFRLQHQHAAALQHTLESWQGLLAQSPQPHVVHLEVLNQLLMILGATHQYDRFPAWAATFERLYAELVTVPLNDVQQQRLREEEGEFALSRALYLASTSLSSLTADTLELQLDLLAQAIVKGTPSTQHFALHRQADILARSQRHDEAAATYARLLQQWPDDRGTHLRLALLTALRQATVDVVAADQALDEALCLAFADASVKPSPLTPQAALDWLHQAAPRDPCYADVIDVLTAYGGMALQRGDLTPAIETLTVLHALVAQARQAHYLAEAFYARSQQAVAGTDQLHDCERALQYAHSALASAPHRQRVSVLLEQIQAHHHRLTAVKRREAVLADYRMYVCRLFARYGVPIQEVVVDQAPSAAPWLALHELVDLDETSGNPVTTIRLCFNPNTSSAEPQPSEPDVALYAQHQREVQRLMETHGMAVFPWPHTAYAGRTAFDFIFPERLALNRDLVFVACAERQALLRYARVFQGVSLTLPQLLTAASPPSVPALAAAARQVTIIPLLHQRLRLLATEATAKARQRQVSTGPEEVLWSSLREGLQTFPAFADAYAYFHAIAEAIRPLLDAPPVTLPRLLDEVDTLQRPARRRSRPRRAKSLPPESRAQPMQSASL